METRFSMPHNGRIKSIYSILVVGFLSFALLSDSRTTLGFSCALIHPKTLDHYLFSETIH